MLSWKKEKRKKFNVVKNLPLDCWCSVVLFFSYPAELINLVLSIKGLWYHIRVVHPYCTRNIEYRLTKSFPINDEVQHVHILVHHAESVLNQPNTDNTSINRFLMDVNKVFPSLNKFDIWIKKLSGDYKNNTTPSVDLFFQENTIMKNLRFLKLDIFEMNITIKSLFPRLEEIVLTESGRRYSSSSDDGIDVNCKHDLNIDWSKLPSIKSVSLFGWKLKSSIEEIRNKVFNLELVNTKLKSNNEKICDFENLRSLSFGFQSINDIKELKNLKELIELRIITTSGYCKFERILPVVRVPRNENGPIFRSFFSLTNFQKLEKIIIEGGRAFFGGEGHRNWIHVGGQNQNNRPKLIIKNLPNLKEFQSSCIQFEVEISETPNLEILKVKSCTLFDQIYSGINLKNLSDGSNLKCFEFQNSLLSDHMFTILPNLKRSLEFLKIEDFAGGESDDDAIVYQIDLVDFQKLKYVHLSASEVYISKVSNCPKLEELCCRVTKNVKISDIPNLKTVGTSGFGNNYIHFFEIISKHDQIKCISLENIDFKDILPTNVFTNKVGHIQHLICSYCLDINFDGENCSDLIWVQNGRFEECGSITLKNHPNLETFEWSLEVEKSFVILENCPVLEYINLEITVTMVNSFRDYVSVVLKDLKSCKNLRLFGQLNQISNIRLDTVPFISRISLKRNRKYEIETEEAVENRFKFQINENTFPLLEILRLEECFSLIEERDRSKYRGMQIWQIDEIDVSKLNFFRCIVLDKSEANWCMEEIDEENSFATKENVFVRKIKGIGEEKSKSIFVVVSIEDYFGFDTDLRKFNLNLPKKNVKQVMSLKKFLESSNNRIEF